MSDTVDPDASRPIVAEVVRGTPTEEELAAAIVVVSESYVREVADATVPDETPRSAGAVGSRPAHPAEPHRRMARFHRLTRVRNVPPKYLQTGEGHCRILEELERITRSVGPLLRAGFDRAERFFG